MQGITPYKAVHVIPDVLERATKRYPDKVAYSFNGNTLSYSELTDRAGRLSSALIEAGVERGDRVGIFLPQSLEIPISIFGILGAGAAFVPIDPMTPQRRVAEIIEKCGIRTLISGGRQAHVLDQISAGSSQIDLVVGAASINSRYLLWEQLADYAQSMPIRLTEQDIAYIMFTSGSTGDPKGMVHTHANGLIYADNLVHYHGLNQNDRFLNLSPLHFDMSVMDHIASLLVGATTIIVPEATARLPASLTNLAAKERISVWYSVPYVMTEMLLKGGMDQHDLTAIRWMIYGGEAFQIKHLRALQLALPNARFCNAYGPAETHQVSSYDIGIIPDDNDYVIPIGKPWKTVETLIVDENNDPVECDEFGELLVHAPSCMLGYWGDKERSEAAFFYQSIDGIIQKKFYRTGDIVTMQHDGMMYFHGRKDRQIKIRGNRVELDAVEAALFEHPSVTDCAVIKDKTDRFLIAAVLLAHDSEFDLKSLRGHCMASLPNYAVPSQFIEVAKFSRTSSLKIDRNALARSLEQAEQ
nr:amino acid adenylation domain-containing protein [uncultured Shimia sp.]